MWKKILITASSIIVVFAIVLSVVLTSFASSFKKGNYYILDEELFNKARTGKNTVYYAYDGDQPIEVFDTSEIIGQEWISLGDVGEYLINGFLSAEDRRFYSHHGIDIKRTVGALFNYFFHVTSSFGASTITQQVVKNISGDNEGTARRKFNEIMRALHLERIYSKDEILEVYLNIVPMTGNVCGVLTASETYFDKKPSELSLSEAATIVGITNSPGRYDPYKNADACKEKRNRVLYAMLDNGVITEKEYKSAASEELVVKQKRDCDRIYSWFIETANKDIINDLVAKKGVSGSAAKVLLRGCKVVLTENIKIQRILEDYFSNEDNFSEQVREGFNYSMAVTDNSTGNLVGIIGGVGAKKGNNLLNLAEIPVPPASTLKPLAIYAPLIDNGSISWSSIVDDTPISVKDGKAGDIVGYPVNSPNVYAGLTTVADAVRLSKNTVAAKLLQGYGYESCVSGLESRYGFKLARGDSANGKTVSDIGIAPLALGQLSYGISIKAMTEAYTAFAREGIYKKAASYHCVFDNSGKLLITPDNQEKQIYSPSTCKIITQMLMQVCDSGTARSITLKNTVDTAGKTGTSSANYDRLFIGYTPYYTAGIWSGYPSRNNAVNGVTPSHLNVWDDVMKKIHAECVFTSKSEPKAFSVSGMRYLPYCLDSGLIPDEACSHDVRGDRVAYGYFTSENAPKSLCTTHVYISGSGDLLSAPKIERSLPDGIFVTDEEYSFDNFEAASGFENEE